MRNVGGSRSQESEVGGAIGIAPKCSRGSGDLGTRSPMRHGEDGLRLVYGGRPVPAVVLSPSGVDEFTHVSEDDLRLQIPKLRR